MAHHNHNASKDLPSPPRPSSMHEYDSLPSMVRQEMRDAPFDYATSSTAEVLAARGEEATIQWLRSGNVINVRHAARVAYGPDHPQAQ